MLTIQGDLLEQSGLLLHQCNTLNLAEAGLALAIRNKWPAWYADFLSFDARLGDVRFCTVAAGVIVGNLYAQSDGSRSQVATDYNSLATCLQVVGILCTGLALPIFVPYGLGCGLGGGDWETVSALLQTYLPEVTIVRLPEKVEKRG